MTAKFFWNMLGGLSNALSSMFFLVFINRILGQDSGGLFSLGLAIAQNLIIVATIEVRNYQSTDLTNNFSFGEYHSLRIVGCIFMILVCLALGLNYGFASSKFLIILLMCVYKVIEAYSDVFEGLYQQNDRIDLAGKAMFYRVFFSTIVFSIFLLRVKNLFVATISMDICAILVCVGFNYRNVKRFTDNICKVAPNKWKQIFVNCLPIAVGAFMIMYIANAPKYAIDRFWDLKVQNVFSIIFMPAFIINLFSLFVFRPLLVQVALAWQKGYKKQFINIIMKALLWFAVISAICLLCSYFLGIPMLSVLYKIDLNEYKFALMVIMCGGALNALMTIFRFTLTAIREQFISLWGFVLSFIFTIMVCPILVKNMGILGACFSYVFSMLIINMIFIIIMAFKIKKMPNMEKQ